MDPYKMGAELVGRLREETARADAAEVIIRELRCKLAEAGVEGSPPPDQDTTIGRWSSRAHDAEINVFVGDTDELRAWWIRHCKEVERTRRLADLTARRDAARAEAARLDAELAAMGGLES